MNGMCTIPNNIKVADKAVQIAPLNSRSERITAIVIDARVGEPKVVKGILIEGDFGFN